LIARSSFKEKIMPSLSSNIFSATANDCVVSKNEIFGLLFIASVLVFTKNMDKENKIISKYYYGPNESSLGSFN